MKFRTKELCYILGILLFVLALGGTNALMQAISSIAQGVDLGIYTIFKIFNHFPTNFYDIVALGVTTNWKLTNVAWIDAALVNIAVLIPSILIFLIAKLGFKLKTLFSTILSIIVLIAVLELFASIVFWIILGFLIVLCVVFLILISNNVIKHN